MRRMCELRMRFGMHLERYIPNRIAKSSMDYYIRQSGTPRGNATNFIAFAKVHRISTAFLKPRLLRKAFNSRIYSYICIFERSIELRTAISNCDFMLLNSPLAQYLQATPLLPTVATRPTPPAAFVFYIFYVQRVITTIRNVLTPESWPVTQLNLLRSISTV